MQGQEEASMGQRMRHEQPGPGKTDVTGSNITMDALPLFKCGKCLNPSLEILDSGGNEPKDKDSILKCKRCSAQYPVNDGIYDFSASLQNHKGQNPSWNPSEFVSLIPENCSLYYSHAEWLEKKLGYSKRVARLVSRYESRFTKDLLINSIRPFDNMTIMDIGCGAGYLSFELLKKTSHKGTRVICLDCLPEHIAMVNARRKEESQYGIIPVIGSADNLHIQDESIDAIICSEVMEHVPDPGRCASEMFRVLKKGGILAVSTPNQRPYERYNTIRLRLRAFLGRPRGVAEDFFDNPLEYTEVAACLARAGFNVREVSLGLKVPFARRFFMYFPAVVANSVIRVLETLLPEKKFAVSVMIRAEKR